MVYGTLLAKWRIGFAATGSSVETVLCSTIECGPMPNVTAAMPNIGGALCSTPQSLANAHYYSAVQ